MLRRWPAHTGPPNISCEAVESDIRELFLFEALMCFFTIGIEYNEPLADVNADIDDDRYDIV